ncbi:MAG: PQQ-binding-like beta-propeller repeat protein [Pirellulales bacterium]|nr:PQQ-binding-like beta-propeller repeat protein [Pirellulales bacterium]
MTDTTASTSEATAPQVQSLYRIARAVIAVAGVFVVLATILMLWDFSRRQAKDPLESPKYLALKAQLAKDPRNEQLKAEIRELDLLLRRQYFRQRQFTQIGTWLLLGGAVVFVVAAKTAAALRWRPPMPQPQPVPLDHDATLGRRGRWAVVGLALVLSAAVLVLAASCQTELPQTLEASGKTEISAVNQAAAAIPGKSGASTPETPPSGAADYPTEDEMAKAWPRFRGPGGLGISTLADPPTKWNGISDEGVVWKTAVPLPGNNSPIVWGNRVFLSGATEEKREVYCFDTGTGELVWQKEVPGTPQSTAKLPELSEDTGFAAPTVATDGRRAYAIFANGDVAAFDFAGKLAWSRSLGIPKNSYGHAASLSVYQNLLIVPFDQGGTKDGLSKLLALDAATGKTAWEAKRQVPNSWTTPIVIDNQGRKQIVTAADPWVIAYGPADGKEIWRAKCLRQDVGPSPAFGGGTVFVANEFPCLSAIRADGQGDVTDTHVLWEGEDGLPDTSSPLATAEYVFLLASYGTLTCYDAKEGKILWEQEFDATFTSSPSLAGARLYLIGKEGKCWVVEPGREAGKIVAESELGEECVTSPAFQPGRMYLRGKEHLFCIGSK